MNTTTKTLSALTGMALIAGSASAATIFSEDFEGTGITGSSFATWNATNASPWVLSNGGADLLGSNYTNATTVGDTFGAINGLGIVSADTGQAILDSYTYTLTFDQVNRNDIAVEGLTAELYNVANGDTLATGAFATPAGTGALGSSISFVAGGAEVGQNIGIRFIDATNNNNPPQGGVDNIVLTAVPEPGSLALLGLGGLCLLRRRRNA